MLGIAKLIAGLNIAGYSIALIYLMLGHTLNPFVIGSAFGSTIIFNLSFLFRLTSWKSDQ